MLIFRWLCLTSFLYQYCVCHDSHSDEKNKVDKYLEILDELVEVLEDLLQNIKSGFEMKNLSDPEMNSGLTEGLDMRMVTTDPPGIVDSGVTISYNIENVFGTTPFVTSSETGPEIDGRDFSETTSPVINLTSDPFTLSTPSDNQSKLSSHLNYSLSNESSGTTFSSYLKTDDIVMTETPIGRFTSDITPKEIPLTTRAFLVSTTAEENDSTILVSNVSTSEVINSTIFENEHESRDKRSAPENFNVSNEIDEILEAIKTELEEGELAEESFLKLEKYVSLFYTINELKYL
ncbi:hypothetical protein Avbf_16932 [Armadillidium vulgare]|nr:hypothetical protein Avbf_16932 [Armadillidium vulgare]